MLGMCALRMGILPRFFCDDDSGAVEGIGEVVRGDLTDLGAVAAFAEGCAAVTVENEWVHPQALQAITDITALRPGAQALHGISDKGRQKQLVAGHGVALGPFRVCETLSALESAYQDLGPQVVVKRCFGSYDGYGNVAVRRAHELADAWGKLHGPSGVLVESFVPFKAEAAVMVARGADGSVATYPVVGTEQRDHRCHATWVPSGFDDATLERARSVAVGVAETFDLVGVAGVELFVLDDGRVWFNEVAPRPHNTGHYTIEACQTSQFENHLRAVLGLPLGSTALRTPAAVMVNVIGTRSGPVTLAKLVDAMPFGAVDVHIYGKRESRPGRKLGHVTATGDDVTALRERAERSAAALVL